MADEKKNKAMWDGKEDDSLFTKPFIYNLLNENGNLVELFKKVEGMNDHRLLAIVTALLVENRVDNVNSFFLPKYNKLTSVRDKKFDLSR